MVGHDDDFLYRHCRRIALQSGALIDRVKNSIEEVEFAVECSWKIRCQSEALLRRIRESSRSVESNDHASDSR